MPSVANGYKSRIQALLGKPENQFCCDCSDKKPSYGIVIAPPEGASMSLGAFICYQCSVVHKKLGKEICKVKNTNVDECKFVVNQGATLDFL